MTQAGALLGLKFLPEPGDPSGSDVKFIQVLTTSYSPTCLGKYGEVKIDNGCRDNPFYSSGPVASFLDRPATGKTNSEYFVADLFLATQGKGNQVTIYDGLAWRWDSSVKFKPKNALLLSQLPPAPPAPPPLKSCLERHNDAYYCRQFINYTSIPVLVLQENPNFTADPSQQMELASNPAAESVPTPAMLPSLVATGIYHGRKWRKRKQQNHNSDNAAD
jgi:hypothetical protein